MAVSAVDRNGPAGHLLNRRHDPVQLGSVEAPPVQPSKESRRSNTSLSVVLRSFLDDAIAFTC